VENTLCPHHFQIALQDLDTVAELVEKLNNVFTYINGHATAPLGVCTFTVGEVRFGLVLTEAQCNALPGHWDPGPPEWQPPGLAAAWAALREQRAAQGSE
jgi:hypothetical protein